VPITRQVGTVAGTVAVTALTDAVGPFFSPRTEAFPDATAAQWAAADRLDPHSVDDRGEWRLHFRCYALRTDDRTILATPHLGEAFTRTP
jgi:hypothetical protein